MKEINIQNTNTPQIVLVNPNALWMEKRPWVQMPLIVAYLTDIFKKNDLDFTFIDANLHNYDQKQLETIISDLSPDIVLLSGLSSEYFRLYKKTLQVIKKGAPDCTTVFGGVCPTVLPEECASIEACDFVFIGPAEYRLPAFLKLLLAGDKSIYDFSGIAYKTPDKVIITDKKDIFTLPKEYPFSPDYSKIDCKGYFNTPIYSHYHYTSFTEPTATIITSFGCKYSCNFCASRVVRKNFVTYRPVESVLEEIRYFYYQHNIRCFSILDELFLADKERVKKILTTIIDEGMKIRWKQVNASIKHIDEELIELMSRSGCEILFLYPESGSPRILKEIIHKPHKLEMFEPVIELCKKHTIFTSANFIIGFPGETWEEIRQTFTFAENADFDHVSFTIATPLPGTELYEEVKSLGLLPDNFSFSNSEFNGFGEALIETNEFSSTELKILRAFEWDRINFSSKEKRKKNAMFMNMSTDELQNHRQKTRQNLGITFSQITN